MAFASDRDGDYEIYAMNADGSNVTQLTHNSDDYAFSTWSPDGLRIAFESDRDGDWEVFAMNADGSNLIQLTRNDVRDISPDWRAHPAPYATNIMVPSSVSAPAILQNSAD